MVDREEYRLWNPYRSKLAAAMKVGMRNFNIRWGDRVLYLGAATGTTASHVSDIVGKDGRVYGLELSERNMREFIGVCEHRSNMLPNRRSKVHGQLQRNCRSLRCDIPGRFRKGPGAHTVGEQQVP